MQVATENAWIKPTVDNRGFMFKKMLAASQAFVDSTGSFSKPVLDLGCAYGVATLPSLQNHQTVIASDLEQKHLDELLSNVPDNQKHLLQLRQGAFPDEIDFEDASLSAAHLSMILHFLSGDEVQEGLRKLFRWIEPGGRLYLNVATPWVAGFGVQDLYEKRIKQGMRWPGEVPSDSFAKEFRERCPEDACMPFMHFFTKETLEPELRAAGFDIEASYYDEIEMGDELKSMFSGGGRGALSVIASRP